MQLVVSHRGTPVPVSLPAAATVGELKSRLAGLAGIEVEHQQLLFR